MTPLAPTLQAFFTDRLLTQRNASPRTIAAYRDTFRLLLSFAQAQAGTPASRLDFADLDAPMIGAFLIHLEQDRGNCPRTRNARLAAIHSFFRYAALRHPEHAASIARVIEIQPNDTSAQPSPTWTRTRSRRSCELPTGPPGSAAATTRSYCSRSRPASGSRNW